MKTLARILLTTAFTVAMLVPQVEISFAGSEGGRIRNPSRLRTPRESGSPGRRMKRPSIPEPEQRIPLRSTARIPSPEPHKRGGSGYVRRGQFFYETPRDIELKRTRGNDQGKPTIPRPEVIGTERFSKDGRRR